MPDLYTTERQAAITAGGTVTVPPGSYTQSQPLLLPLDTAVTLIGTDVTVTLDAACPGPCLEFASSEDYQTFRNITIRGFSIDASLVTADYTDRAVIGTTRLGTHSGVSWMNYLHDILIEDVDITMPASISDPDLLLYDTRYTGIALVSRQSSSSNPLNDGEPQDYVTVEHVTVQRVNIYDGDMSVVIVALRGYGAGYEGSPWAGNKVRMDDINVIDCHHLATYGNPAHMMWNSFHIGSMSYGDSVLVSNCTSFGAGEGGFEINGFDNTVIEHCTSTDSGAIGFMFYDFNDQVNPYTQTILFNDCHCVNTGPLVYSYYYSPTNEWLEDHRVGFNHGSTNYGTATGAVTFNNCTAATYSAGNEFLVLGCFSVTYTYSDPEVDPEVDPEADPEAVPSGNPLFDGTLSLKVAGVEYAAYAGALQFESVAPGGFGAASFEVYSPASFTVSPPDELVLVDANIIPTMTSATTPSGVASGSGAYNPSYAEWKAFDNGQATFWSGPTATPWFLQYQLPSARMITRYAITPPESRGVDGPPKTWTFQGSTDGTTWTTLDAQTNITDWAHVEPSVRKIFDFVNTTLYAYLRLNIASGYDPDYVGVGKLEMMESIWVDVSPIDVPASPFDIPTTFPELVNEAEVVVNHGAVVLYEGHIVGDPTIAKLTDGESLIAVECGGLLDKAKYRQDYGETWVDTTYDNWLRHRASDKGFADTIDGKLRLDVNDGQTFTEGDIAGIFYRVNQGIVTSPDNKAFALDFEYDLALASAAWRCDIWAAPYYVDTLDEADWTTWIWHHSNTTAAGTAHVDFPAGTRCVALIMRVDGNGTSGAKRHAEITNLRVFCTGDEDGTEPRVDSAMRDCGVVTGLATAGDTDTIGNQLKQCMIPPSTTRADGLDKLASMYEAPVDWGFWESSTLRVKKRLNSPADNVAIRALAGAGVTQMLSSFSPVGSAFPADWWRSGPFNGARTVYASDERFALTTPAGGTEPELLSPRFAVTPGTDIHVACYVEAIELTGGGIFAAYYKFFDIDGVGLADANFAYREAACPAELVEVVVTVPAGADTVAFGCFIAPGTGASFCWVTGVEIGGTGTAQAAYLLDARTPAFDYDVHKYEEGKFDYVRAIFTQGAANRIGTPSPSGDTWPTDWWRSEGVVADGGRFKFVVAATPLGAYTPAVDGFAVRTPDTASIGCRIELTTTVPADTTIRVRATVDCFDDSNSLISTVTAATTDIAGAVTAQDSILKGSVAVPAGTVSVAYEVDAERLAGTGTSTLLFSPVDFHDQFPSGALRTVCAPHEPPADADVKVGILDLTGRGDMTVDIAFRTATQALAWIDSTLETGTIPVFSPTVPLALDDGSVKLAAYMRASDWVECKQVSDAAELVEEGSSRPLWISSSHVDVDEGVTTLTIEPYPFDVAESDFGHAHMSRLRRWKKARRGMYRKQKAALRKAQAKENKTKLGSGHKRRIHYI